MLNYRPCAVNPIKLRERAKITVPLITDECSFRRTCVNHAINKWLFMEQKRVKSNPNKQSQPLLKLLPEYRQTPVEPLADAIKPFLETDKFKRISPQFLKLLEGDGVYSHDRKPNKVERVEPVPKHDPTALDNTYPQLATYLRNTMENGGITNAIYGIDFYNNVDSANTSRDACEDIDSYQVVRLLKRLMAGNTLTSDQVVFLMNTLQCLGEFNAAKLDHFFKVLHAEDALNVRTIIYLQKLLLNLIGVITPIQFDRISHALEKAEKYSNPDARKQGKRKTFGELDKNGRERRKNATTADDEWGAVRIRRTKKINGFLIDPDEWAKRAGKGDSNTDSAKDAHAIFEGPKSADENLERTAPKQGQKSVARSHKRKSSKRHSRRSRRSYKPMKRKSKKYTTEKLPEVQFGGKTIETLADQRKSRPRNTWELNIPRFGYGDLSTISKSNLPEAFVLQETKKQNSIEEKVIENETIIKVDDLKDKRKASLPDEHRSLRPAPHKTSIFPELHYYKPLHVPNEVNIFKRLSRVAGSGRTDKKPKSKLKKENEAKTKREEKRKTKQTASRDLKLEQSTPKRKKVAESRQHSRNFTAD